MEHTRGPWRVGDAGHTVFGPKREDGSLPERIADVKKGDNARLIAAAPDLLQACRAALLSLEDELYKPEYGTLYRTITDAIAKAEGR